MRYKRNKVLVLITDRHVQMLINFFQKLFKVDDRKVNTHFKVLILRKPISKIEYD